MSDRLQEFIQCLRNADSVLSENVGLGPGVEDIADMLWFARKIAESQSPRNHAPPSGSSKQGTSHTRHSPSIQRNPSNSPQTNVSPQSHASQQSGGTLTPQPEPSLSSKPQTPKVQPIRIPAAAAIRQPLELARALRPLIRKIESKTEKVIDEEATAIALAEDRRIGIILRPTLERWLELELVIEHSLVVDLWEQATQEITAVLEQLGAFRTIRIWTLETQNRQGGRPELCLTPGRKNSGNVNPRQGKIKELVDTTGNRMVMLLSDCISPLWQHGVIHHALSLWSKHGQVVLVQWFPERYWKRTSLKYGDELWLSGLSAGLKSQQLSRHYPSFNPETLENLFEDDEPENVQKKKELILPVVSLESTELAGWAGVVAGRGKTYVRGRRFELTESQQGWRGPRFLPQPLPSSGLERLESFLKTASDLAQELAKLMSLAPVSPEITNLIQETLLPTSSAVHVAEVYLSGLLEAQEQGRYHFYSGVQEELQKITLSIDKKLVFRVLSRYINDRYGRTPREFTAFIQKHSDCDKEKWAEIEGFAELEEKAKSTFTLPSLQTLSFVSAYLADPSLADPYFPPELYTEEFSVPTIAFNASEEPESETPSLTFMTAKILKRDQEWEIEREVIEIPPSDYFIETLSESISLTLLKIPAGTFMMGAPENEVDQYDFELPQHLVNISQSFWLGQTPITEAQWHFACNLPKENRPLNTLQRSNGDNHPITAVSWLEAVEFCDRLSTHTDCTYRLPTEAEWEYACRAGTTTPFYFGETISPELANYNSEDSYNNGPTGASPGGSTPVGQYDSANRWGLSDLHGNVWEWCQDNWHNNYKGAPNDGSAWGHQDEASHVIRGGSWNDDPWNCRSASRGDLNIYFFVGFRVACSAPRM